MFRTLSLWVGYIITTALLVVLVLGGLRYAYVELTGPSVNTYHLEQKENYLAELQPEVAPPMNIVIIFFDDLGWGDLSSYGNPAIKTPEIDAIAEQGLRMTDFYSASPVCTPSRAALLTGRFPPRTRTDRHVFFNDDHAIGIARRMLGLANALPKEEITLAEVLQAKGYATHMVGKWHLGSTASYWPTDFGFDNWFGVLYSNDMYPFHLYENSRMLEEDQREGGLFASERDEGRPLPGQGIDQSTLTQRYTEQAIDFLEDSRDAPFFLYLAHSFPHVPHYPAQEFAGQSAGGTYGDVVEDLDRSTGAIAAALDRLDLSSNTLLIITSDNGADYNGSSGPLRGRKQETLEGGQRVPMVVRWPDRIAPGKVSNALGMNTDIFPTILDVLSTEPPRDRIIDGKSLLSTWTQDTPAHEQLYYFPVTDPLPGAIRDRRFKLTLSTGDLGRNRPHLSNINHYEAHEVSSLYPDTYERLYGLLQNARDQIEANPRGWRDR